MNMIIQKKVNSKSEIRPSTFQKSAGRITETQNSKHLYPNCGQNKKHEARGKKQDKNLVSNFWRLASGTMNTILSL